MKMTTTDLEEASRVVEGGPLSEWALVSLAGESAPAVLAERDVGGGSGRAIAQSAKQDRHVRSAQHR